MPRTISIIDYRSWLDLHEQGKSIAKIAKETKHDIRTIERGIEVAQRESDIRVARSGLIKEALQSHQGDLVEVIESLRTAIILPMRTLSLPVGFAPGQQIALPKITAKYDFSREWSIKFEIETNMKWELFDEHMKHDPVLKLIAHWRTALANHLEAKRTLLQQFADIIQKRTGLKIVDNIVKAPKEYLYPAGIGVLYFHLLNWMCGNTNKLENNLKEGEVYLNYGKDNISILIAPGATEKYKQEILTAFEKIEKSEFVDETIKTYGVLEETTQKASRAIEDLFLARMVPGHCRVCRRLGL
jgi:hypothetical protein